MSNASSGSAIPPEAPGTVRSPPGANPYRRADRRQAQARARVEGPWAFLPGLAPFAAAGVALWLARDLYGTLLGSTPGTWGGGLTAVSSRVGMALAAALSLSTYDIVVRGPDRGVLDTHPLLPHPWLRARALLLLRQRAPWLAVAAVFLAPLLEHPAAFGLGSLVVLGSWVAGIGAGLGVNLAAPGMGTRPELAGVLDAIRGQNPRVQAALLYAPGCSVAIAGTAALAAAWGAGELFAGRAVGLAGVALPFLVAWLGWLLAVAYAPERARLGAILGEIDAAWAMTESPEEAHAVYLEWTVRFLPPSARVALRKELRHLWRGQRAWVTGSWLLVAVSALAAWTESPSAPARFVPAAAGSVAVLGYVAVRLGASDPAWLEGFFRPRHVVLARAFAVWATAVWVPLVGASILLLRQGRRGLVPIPWLLVASAVLALVGAWSGDRLRGRGTLLYVPIAIICFALVNR